MQLLAPTRLIYIGTFHACPAALLGLRIQAVAPDDIKTQWQEANANRRMQFKVGNYKDSNIRMLTGTIKADWIQLPVERYYTPFLH